MQKNEPIHLHDALVKRQVPTGSSLWPSAEDYHLPSLDRSPNALGHHAPSPQLTDILREEAQAESFPAPAAILTRP